MNGNCTFRPIFTLFLNISSNINRLKRYSCSMFPMIKTKSKFSLRIKSANTDIETWKQRLQALFIGNVHSICRFPRTKKHFCWQCRQRKLHVTHSITRSANRQRAYWRNSNHSQQTIHTTVSSLNIFLTQ